MRRVGRGSREARGEGGGWLPIQGRGVDWPPTQGKGQGGDWPPSLPPFPVPPQDIPLFYPQDIGMQVQYSEEQYKEMLHNFKINTHF